MTKDFAMFLSQLTRGHPKIAQIVNKPSPSNFIACKHTDCPNKAFNQVTDKTKRNPSPT